MTKKMVPVKYDYYKIPLNLCHIGLNQGQMRKLWMLGVLAALSMEDQGHPPDTGEEEVRYAGERGQQSHMAGIGMAGRMKRGKNHPKIIGCT